MLFFWIIWGIALVIVLAYGVVILFGAPYLPTMAKDRRAALDMLALKKGQLLIDLGSGDGGLLVEAGNRGLRAIGYEINPILVLISWARTLRFGRRVGVRWGNFWRADIADADGIFVFLLDRFMPRLDKKLATEVKPGIKLVSHAFKIPGRQPQVKKGALFLYQY
jgi:SAM-dependent methyltransferase